MTTLAFRLVVSFWREFPCYCPHQSGSRTSFREYELDSFWETLNGKTFPLWFPNVCQPQMGTHGLHYHEVLQDMIHGGCVNSQPLNLPLPQRTPKQNRWHCPVYAEQAKLHWLFNIFIWHNLLDFHLIISHPLKPSVSPRCHEHTKMAIRPLYMPTPLSLAIPVTHLLTSFFFFNPFLSLIFSWWQYQSLWSPERHSLMQSVAPRNSEVHKQVSKGGLRLLW